jgi:penicillin amidase
LSLARCLSPTRRAERQRGTNRRLSQPVEIIRDRWGINHIYAQNEADLFFAQGYAGRARSPVPVRDLAAAGDRHRGGDSRRRELRAIAARGCTVPRRLDDELNRYHPRGKAIIESYVRGVNAYIAETSAIRRCLPIEFRCSASRRDAGRRRS